MKRGSATMLALSCSGLIAGAALPAVAADADAELPSVVLITDRRDHPMAQRLLAELATLNANTVLVDRRAQPARDDVLSIVGQAHAAAALTVFASTARVELWLIDLDGPKVALNEPIPRAIEEANLLALRLLELLRARLIPLPPRERKSSIEATPESKIDRDDEPPELFASRVGGGPTFAPGGLGAMAHLWLGFGWRAWPRVELEIVGAIPLAAGSTSGDEGTARGRAGLATLGARLLLADGNASLVPSLSGSLGVCFLNVAGTAVPPFTSESSWIVTAVGLLRAGLSLRLIWRARLALDGLLGMLLPGAAVDFAGREAATWGRPLLGLLVGLEVGL